MPNLRTSRNLVAWLVLLMLFLCVSAFAQNDKKVAYAVLIDNTGSMRSQFQDVLTIGEEILDHIPEQAIVSIYNFQPSKKNASAVINAGLGWSQSRDQQKEYLDRLYVVSGQTTLLDAVSSVTKDLNVRVNHDGDFSTEKILFLVTDGEERTSKASETQLLQELRDSNVKVYIFGMVKELGNGRAKDRAVDLLARIAKETGGRSVFSRSKKDDVLSLLNEMFAK